jgi:tetratricopeptide (TPR) repeat protein
MAVIFAVVWVCYFPALWAGFIWDDTELFAENPLLHTTGYLWRIWFAGETPDFFPVTSTSLWVDLHLWGQNPMGYHAVNIALHGFSAVLLWMILRRLKVEGAFFAALLFAVHPVNAASVAWISERKNTLSLLLCLAALLCWLRGQDEKSRPLWFAAIILFLLALLAKTSVVMLPVVLLLILWWRKGRITRCDCLNVAPFFLASLLLGLVTVAFQHRGLTVPHEALMVRLARFGWAIAFYAGKVFWPFNLCMVYPAWHRSLISPVTCLPTAGLALLFAGLLLSGAKWCRHLLLGFGYFVTMLVPVSGLIWMNFMQQSWVADWWQYAAMPGLIALFAAALVRSLQKCPRVLCAVCIFIIAGLGALTFNESQNYKSLEINCRHNLAKNPQAWGIRNNLARELTLQRRSDEAVALLREGLKLAPDHLVTLDNLGKTLVNMERWQEAYPVCRRVVDLNANYAAGHVTLGVVLVGLQHYDDASGEFRQAVRLLPARIDYRLKLIRSLAISGHFQAAMQEMQNAIRAAEITGQHESLAELSKYLDYFSKNSAPMDVQPPVPASAPAEKPAK